MIERCRCCHRHLGAIRIGDWCEGCATGVLEDVGRLQGLKPADLVQLSGIFNECGAFFLVRAMVGALPFEETLTRLTDE